MSDPTISSPLGTAGVVESDPAQRSQAMLGHILGIFSILGTGIYYLIKKNDPKAGPFVKDQIREAFNFQLAVFLVAFLYGIVTSIVVAVTKSAMLGMLMSLVSYAIGLGSLVLLIMAAMKANKGEAARYPVKLPVLK